jgi:RNA polymerase sigma-70 factor, ECF subfamily
MQPIQPARLVALFDAHGARLVLYARQWLDRDQAEDVVQDVFVSLMTSHQSPQYAKAWLYKAVRNAAITVARSGGRRRSRERFVANRRPEMFEHKVADLIDAAAAEKALTGLPHAQREIVVLRIWGQMTLAEVAETVGLAISSVHDAYRTALSALRQAMEKPCRNTNQS